MKYRCLEADANCRFEAKLLEGKCPPQIQIRWPPPSDISSCYFITLRVVILGLNVGCTACAWVWNYKILHECHPSVKGAKWKSYHFLFIENVVGSETGLVTYPNRQVGSERVTAWLQHLYYLISHLLLTPLHTTLSSQKKWKRQVPVLWSPYTHRWDETKFKKDKR